LSGNKKKGGKKEMAKNIEKDVSGLVETNYQRGGTTGTHCSEHEKSLDQPNLEPNKGGGKKKEKKAGQK